jgi:very-short-patch-repair endonuclease
MPDSFERGMFYGAKPDIFEKANHLRSNLTECETLVWNRLNKDKVLGFRFKCQHPIDIFIADFYCHKLRLVIEIDGGIHKTLNQREYDEGRTAEIESFDIKVIRFTNDEVKKDINGVIRKIVQICIERKKELGLNTPNP